MEEPWQLSWQSSSLGLPDPNSPHKPAICSRRQQAARETEPPGRCGLLVVVTVQKLTEIGTRRIPRQYGRHVVP